jgi:hypothetical protein
MIYIKARNIKEEYLSFKKDLNQKRGLKNPITKEENSVCRDFHGVEDIIN